ncbi:MULTISPECIES: aminotransferase class I/II-fold pyridoxal phosphate-dependent enzyme [unclassified Methylobacterium]|uniref:pyridoxal phosphate-dependent aminotransferase n=1 Tax=unclassified Methylobacterium TaxID=2615210 RepID=UPI0011C1E7DB|nr:MULTISPECIES: aminotransferase class I/II-fold pyridoxal phosphate-dependent enzyme [unclassified Methylobacterium]QEE37807.1 aminotransferase class I/II-fold pyridoxal phosphate-dependent enzyme [Methylobacterium sp. WL1]TXN05963.1 aminotransferase class I/II-fold pyridoxal phosphate-dependent enzyme [Methylobacterium sp. WL64]TXN59486.1 aminotransferase class I/II-fold pyridoxal phosphate-dependent enzyme [Methylobacterium sp. WL2]
MIPISRRAAAVQPFLAMDVMAAAAAKARRGDDVVRMEVGQPSAPAPRAVIAAAQAALATGRVPYTEALGLPALRERIARDYAERHRVAVSPERVVITTGSSAGFVLAFMSLFDAGARVAVPQPGYPAYRSILASLDLVPAPMVLRVEDRFAPTAALLREAHARAPVAGALVMSPANPSGTVITEDALRDLCTATRDLNLPLISDEIYHGLSYGVPTVTALRFDPDAVVINSFSKYHCMTGWRVGWMVVPEVLVRPIERLAQNLYISAPYLSQIGALAALDATEELDAVRDGYARNRAILLDALPGLGLGRVHPADGAFYLYADVANLTNDATDFCRRMLDEANVAATPGLDFDPDLGHHHVRFSFAGSEAECREAVVRLRTWLR